MDHITDDLRDLATALAHDEWSDDDIALLHWAAKTIDKLPKTADGVPVVPGMRVWRLAHPTTLGHAVTDVSVRGMHLAGKSDWHESCETFSTREAAEAAGEE